MRGRQLLAWNLRRVRVSKGLSQEKLAADAGIDRAYLGGIERRSENPSLDLLDRLAVTLDVGIADLLRQPKAGEREPETLRPGRPRLQDEGAPPRRRYPDRTSVSGLKARPVGAAVSFPST